jgi:hypothetical protein
MNLNWIFEAGTPESLKLAIEEDWTYFIPSNIASINPKALSSELVIKMDSLIDLPVDQRRKEMASIIKEYGTAAPESRDDNNNDEDIII